MVGARLPSQVRSLAHPDEVQKLQREDAQAWTVSDLPLLDAARQRLGDPETSRRERRRRAAVAAERAYMDRVVDDLIEADDDGEGLVTALRQQDLRDALVDEAALPNADSDRLAGPFAHIVVDEAQELTDAEWQMLLRRCPSRSFTIVGDRAQARHGFTESVAGTARADRARQHQPGHTEHQLPDAGRGHGGSRASHPGRVPGRQRAAHPSAEAVSALCTDRHPTCARSSTLGSAHTPTASRASSTLMALRTTRSWRRPASGR